MTPLEMGLVVTLSPSLKRLDPLTMPVIALSLPFFHCSIVGTPRGAVLDLATGSGDVFAAVFPLPGLSKLKNDPNERVGDEDEDPDCS
mmetsp:Transcript_20680/g.38673  ORF Transcript_20680/g.38673 Transcript_20680/m.38673 type:complete len:88 (-) Transcript_20680:129-392(-)